MGGSTAPCLGGREQRGKRQFGPKAVTKLSLAVGFLWSFKSSNWRQVPLLASGDHCLVTLPQVAWMAEGSQKALLLCLTREPKEGAEG